jgi:Electron transfer DM13
VTSGLVSRRRWLSVVAGAIAAIVLPGAVAEAQLMAGMTLVAQGRFRDSDILHRGSGDAMVYRRADGSLLLRLDNFRVTAGPDLFIYLARHAAPENMKDVKKGFLSIARLKANTGTQDYELPAGTALADYGSVVVYCQIFGVLFSAASLTNVIG